MQESKFYQLQRERIVRETTIKYISYEFSENEVATKQYD